MPGDNTELYKKYRPQRLEDVVGQAVAVRTLKSFKDVPHAILFHGPSGCGKTTLARIMATRLGCVPDNAFDYSEINCGIVESGLEMAREIDRGTSGGALVGKARIWVLDEVQSLSRARFAQEALLKVLEEVPRHVYFMLCTTDPKKVLTAIRNRCTEIAVKPIPSKELRAVLADVAGREKAKVTDELLDKIVDFAAGSARRALVELEKALGIDDPDERLAAIGAAGAERAAFDLVRVLMPWKGKPQWSEVAQVLKDIEDQEPEGLRLLLLASARSMLLKNGSPLAYLVIDCLREALFDNGGKAVLAARCWEICREAK